MNVGHEHASPVKRLSVRGIAICVEFFMMKGHEVKTLDFEKNHMHIIF